MLRFLFGQPPASPQGTLAEAMQSIRNAVSEFRNQVQQSGDKDHKQRTYEIWSLGLLSSLDELEQSYYAAQQFGRRIHSRIVETLNEEEMLDYRRYVYFDKNGFIRLFALLDKLGTLLNDVLHLETERVKPHFSYFTVVRRMLERNMHAELAAKLSEVKQGTVEAVSRLRKRRNVEVHNMNSELQDDLMQNHLHYGDALVLEDIEQQMKDAEQGLYMAVQTLRIAFDYLNTRHKSHS